MRDEVTTWRAVPPALYAWFAVELVYTVLTAVVFHAEWFGLRVMLVWSGIAMASAVLAMFGAFELASRSTGTARTGLQVAAWSSFATLVLGVIFELYFELVPHVPQWLVDVDMYVWFALDLVIAIGWTLAALRHRAIAAAAITVAVLCGLPSHVYDAVLPGNGFGWLRIVFSALHLLALGALVVTAARGKAIVDPARGARGLRIVAGSMTLRVLTAVLGALALGFAAMSTGAGGGDALKLGLVGAAAIGVIAQAVLACGLLDAARAAVPELGRWPLVAAAAASAWTAGVGLRQLTALYVALYRVDPGDAVETAQALPVAIALVTCIALIALVIALGAFARRRSDADLSVEVFGRGAPSIVLWLASLGVTTWAIPTATSARRILLVGLAAIAMLAATLLLASLCRRVADVVRGSTTLPGARVIQSR